MAIRCKAGCGRPAAGVEWSESCRFIFRDDMPMRNLLEQWGRWGRGDVVFRRMLANSSWLFGANLVSLAMGLLQVMVATRILGLDQFGVLALITSYTVTVNQFLDSRVWEAAIKYVIEFREKGEQEKATAVVKLCYLIDGLTGALAFALIVLSAGLVAGIFVKQADAAGLVQFYSLSVLIAVPTGTSSALLRIDNRFTWLAYHNTGTAALRLLSVCIVALLHWRIKGVLGAYLFSSAASALVLIALSRQSSARLMLTTWRKAPLGLLRGHLRRILTFTFHTNLVGTSRIISSRADTLLLGALSTPANVGLYKLAKALADPLSVILGPVYNAVYPEISRLVSKGDLLALRSLQRKCSGITAATVFPACFLLTFAVPWLIPLAFGPQFAAAVPLTQILLWQVIWAPMLWVPGWLLSLERARTLAILNWVDATLYLGLLLVFVSHWGALGAAIATLLRLVLWTVMALGVFFHINRTLTRRASGSCETANRYYEGKWQHHDGYWHDLYSPAQAVYATSLYDRRNARILEHVPPGLGSVLDIGCGVGDVMQLIAEKSAVVVGIDIATVNVQMTRRNLVRSGTTNAVVSQAKAEQIPFRDGVFDLVVMADVIEHIPDVDAALREVRRVLRPGGLFVCVTQRAALLRSLGRADHLLSRALLRLRTSPQEGMPGPIYEHFLSTRAILTALERSGFTVAFRRPICFYPGAEGGGTVALMMSGLFRVLGLRLFGYLARALIHLCDLVERFRILNQKQILVGKTERNGP